MSGAHVHDVHVSKKIKCENPFPNWKPITKISYLELDIIVSKLVYMYKNCLGIWTSTILIGLVPMNTTFDDQIKGLSRGAQLLNIP